jgi:hypothetical protein
MLDSFVQFVYDTSKVGLTIHVLTEVLLPFYPNSVGGQEFLLVLDTGSSDLVGLCLTPLY